MHQCLQGAGIPEHINELNKVFDVELPFHGVVTSYERKKFIKENFLYIVCIVYNFTYVFFVNVMNAQLLVGFFWLNFIEATILKHNHYPC